MRSLIAGQVTGQGVGVIEGEIQEGKDFSGVE